MSERDIGQEILEGIREVKAYKAGKIDLRTRELKEPSLPQDIRRNLNLSQSAFAGLMGVSLRTVQDWEQGRRQPSGPAKSLLLINFIFSIRISLSKSCRDLNSSNIWFSEPVHSIVIGILLTSKP